MCVVCIILGLIANAHCADLGGKDTLQDVVHHYVGKAGLVACNIFIFIHNFGACIALLVVIADQIDRGVYIVDSCVPNPKVISQKSRFLPLLFRYGNTETTVLFVSNDGSKGVAPVVSPSVK